MVKSLTLFDPFHCNARKTPGLLENAQEENMRRERMLEVLEEIIKRTDLTLAGSSTTISGATLATCLSPSVASAIIGREDSLVSQDRRGKKRGQLLTPIGTNCPRIKIPSVVNS